MCEIARRVDTYKIFYSCPKCKIGELEPTGSQLSSYPPQYPHKCSNKGCNHEEIFRCTYPKIEYTEIE